MVCYTSFKLLVIPNVVEIGDLSVECAILYSLVFFWVLLGTGLAEPVVPVAYEVFAVEAWKNEECF